MAEPVEAWEEPLEAPAEVETVAVSDADGDGSLHSDRMSSFLLSGRLTVKSTLPEPWPWQSRALKLLLLCPLAPQIVSTVRDGLAA